MENTMERKSNPGFVYGLMAGLIVVVFTLLQYLGGLDMYLSPVGYVSYLVIITMAVLAALKTRRANEGELSFAEALKITFAVFAIAMLLQTLFVYVLFNFIDVSFKQAVSQEVLNKTERMMKRFGASDEQIDKAIESERSGDQFAFGKVLLGYAVSCIAAFIICLLISAIVKKSKPVFNQL
jgi:hypothetical protein